MKIGSAPGFPGLSMSFIGIFLFVLDPLATFRVVPAKIQVKMWLFSQPYSETELRCFACLPYITNRDIYIYTTQ